MHEKTYDPNKKFVGSVLPTPKHRKWQGVHSLKEKKEKGKPLQYEWTTDWSDGSGEGGTVDAKHAAPAELPHVMNKEPPPASTAKMEFHFGPFG